MTKKREVLLLTMGSAGDVHPLIALGMGLKARGHRVTLMTNDHFEQRTLDAGLEFLATSIAEDYLELMKDPDLWNLRKALRLIFEVGSLPIMRPVYDILSEYDPAETIVLSQSLIFGARIAQEHLGMPMFSIVLQPSILRSNIDPPVIAPPITSPAVPPSIQNAFLRLVDRLAIDPIVAKDVNGFRAELGLPPASGFLRDWHLSPQGILGLWPASFAPKPSDWPANMHLSGFLNFETTLSDIQREMRRAGLDSETSKTPDPRHRSAAVLDSDPTNRADSFEGSLDSDLESFLSAGSPPLVFTPGSAMSQGQNFFGAALDACLRLDRRGLFLSPYADQIPDDLPDNIRHFSYAPFSELLPRSAALIYHGGIGTLAQALAAGIPHLIMPMSHDQPDNARRIRAMGVGDFLNPWRFKGPALARKLERLLESPEVRLACERHKSSVNYSAALETCCDQFELLLRDLA